MRIFGIINNNTRKTGVLVLTLNNVSSRNHTRTQTDLIRTECTGHANPHLVQTLISINGVDSFTRDSSDVGHTGVFGRTRTNLKFFPEIYKSTGRSGQAGISLTLRGGSGRNVCGIQKPASNEQRGAETERRCCLADLSTCNAACRLPPGCWENMDGSDGGARSVGGRRSALSVRPSL